MDTIKSKLYSWLLAGALALSFSFGHAIPEEKPLPPETVAALKEKEVPASLRLQLDNLFMNPPIQNLLAALYNADTEHDARRAQEGLQEHGFAFLGDKFHVFTHPNVPRYVFKIAIRSFNRTERLNASRIVYAEKLRRIIALHKLKIIVPKKFAYFVPQLRPWRNLLHKKLSLPKIIVAAQKLNLAGATSELPESLDKDLKILEKEAHYIDIHSDNILYKEGYGYIPDTEEHTDDTIQALHTAPALQAQTPQPQPEAAFYKVPFLSDIKGFFDPMLAAVAG